MVLEDARDPVGRLETVLGGDRLDPPDQAGLEAGHEGEEQGLLGREVPVDGGLGEAHPRGDLLHRQLGEAGRGGELQGAVEDVLLPLRGAHPAGGRPGATVK